MSYFQPGRPFEHLGAGLGASYPFRRTDPTNSAAELQRHLVRLGFMPATTDAQGVDNKVGPNTLAALRHAATYVRWTGNAYTPANAEQRAIGTVVTIDDALLERIARAAPAPVGTPGRVLSAPSPQLIAQIVDEEAPADRAPIVIGPHLDPEPRAEAEREDDSWVGPAMLGIGILAVGVGAVVAFWPQIKEKRRYPLAANRRRRRGRRRRRS